MSIIKNISLLYSLKYINKVIYDIIQSYKTKRIVMSNVYITNYSIKLISRSLADSLRNKKYNRAFYIDKLSESVPRELLGVSDSSLSDIDLKEVYAQKNILEDFENLIDDVENNRNILSLYIQKHNKQYAYDIKAPSYHAKHDCQWLNSNFNNIEVPNDIKDNTG